MAKTIVEATKEQYSSRTNIRNTQIYIIKYQGRNIRTFGWVINKRLGRTYTEPTQEEKTFYKEEYFRKLREQRRAEAERRRKIAEAERIRREKLRILESVAELRQQALTLKREEKYRIEFSPSKLFVGTGEEAQAVYEKEIERRRALAGELFKYETEARELVFDVPKPIVTRAEPVKEPTVVREAPSFEPVTEPTLPFREVTRAVKEGKQLVKKTTQFKTGIETTIIAGEFEGEVKEVTFKAVPTLVTPTGEVIRKGEVIKVGEVLRPKVQRQLEARRELLKEVEKPVPEPKPILQKVKEAGVGFVAGFGLTFEPVPSPTEQRILGTGVVYEDRVARGLTTQEMVGVPTTKEFQAGMFGARVLQTALLVSGIPSAKRKFEQQVGITKPPTIKAEAEFKGYGETKRLREKDVTIGEVDVTLSVEERGKLFRKDIKTTKQFLVVSKPTEKGAVSVGVGKEVETGLRDISQQVIRQVGKKEFVGVSRAIVETPTGKELAVGGFYGAETLKIEMPDVTITEARVGVVTRVPKAPEVIGVGTFREAVYTPKPTDTGLGYVKPPVKTITKPVTLPTTIQAQISARALAQVVGERLVPPVQIVTPEKVAGVSAIGLVAPTQVITTRELEKPVPIVKPISPKVSTRVITEAERIAVTPTVTQVVKTPEKVFKLPTLDISAPVVKQITKEQVIPKIGTGLGTIQQIRPLPPQIVPSPPKEEAKEEVIPKEEVILKEEEVPVEDIVELTPTPTPQPIPKVLPIVKPQVEIIRLPTRPFIPPRLPSIQLPFFRGWGIPTGRVIKGFGVEVRKAGKFVAVPSVPLTKMGALALGKKIVAETPRATFRIREKGLFPERMVKRGGFFDLTGLVRKDSLFIEPPRFRIRTRGELLGITFKGIEARRKGVKRKRKKKKKKKIIVKKGKRKRKSLFTFRGIKL